MTTASANGATKGVKLLLEYGAAASLEWVGAHPEGFRKGAAGSGMSAEVWAAHPMSKRYTGKHTALQWAELYQHAACQKLLIKAAGEAAEGEGDGGDGQQDEHQEEEEAEDEEQEGEGEGDDDEHQEGGREHGEQEQEEEELKSGNELFGKRSAGGGGL